jgi:hypothetical protein
MCIVQMRDLLSAWEAASHRLGIIETGAWCCAA